MMEWAVILLLGLQGYFTIFRLTPDSGIMKKSLDVTNSGIATILEPLLDSVKVIRGLDKRLNALETEIKLRQMDSQRIIEWLDKRDKELAELDARVIKHLKLEEREKRMEAYQTEIVELSKNLRIITAKK